MSDAPDCCRKSFAASIKDTAARLLADPSFAPSTVAQERLAICGVCEHYTQSSTCGLCQCFMPAKVKMSNMKCPIDKWIEHVH